MRNDCIFCAIAAGEIPSFKVYEDAPDASYLANKQKYVITERQVTAADTLALRAAPGGGFAVSIEPLEE